MWPALLGIATTYLSPEPQSFLLSSFLPSLFHSSTFSVFFSAPIPKDFQVFICNKHFYTYLAEKNNWSKEKSNMFYSLSAKNESEHRTDILWPPVVFLAQ